MWSLDAGEVANGWFGNGLTNPRGAEIHMVLRDHGPVITEFLEDQLSSFRGGCTDESVPEVLPPAVQMDGEPGPYDCQDVQFTILQQ